MTTPFLRLLTSDDKESDLSECISDISSSALSDHPKVFPIESGDLSSVPNSPFAYWISTTAKKRLQGLKPIEGEIAEIRVGLQTGDDRRFLRNYWEVVAEKISLEGPNDYYFYTKTDKAAPFISPIYLLVQYKRNGYEVKNHFGKNGKLRSRPQNEAYYLNSGISYMLRSLRLVPYIVPSNTIPTAGRAQVYGKGIDIEPLLVLLSSNIASAYARFSGESSARPKFQAGMVQSIPSPGIQKLKSLDIKKTNLLDSISSWLKYYASAEPCIYFSGYHGSMQKPEIDLRSLIGQQAEKQIASLYGMTDSELREFEIDIEDAVLIKESSRRSSTEADNALTKADSEDEDDNSEDEEDDYEKPDDQKDAYFSFFVGILFGRFDSRIARDPSFTPALPNPFAPLPVCPPAMLVGADGLPARADNIASETWLRARPNAISLPSEPERSQKIRAADYPIDVPWDGILVDDPDDGRDIVARLRAVLSYLYGAEADAKERELCAELGVSDIRDYLRKPSLFFDSHLKRYSKSRRKAPIYWPLQTRDGRYTIWLYYPRLTADTLYGCSNILEDKLKLEKRKLELARAELSDKGGKAERARVEELADFVAALTEMKEEIDRVAGLPYKTDLDDGVQISASPLWKLFRLPAWQRELKSTWEELAEGKYDWAHLAYAIWPDRVREKCKKDRSLAIAHGLEDICEQKAPEAKAAVKKRGRKTEARNLDEDSSLDFEE